MVSLRGDSVTRVRPWRFWLRINSPDDPRASRRLPAGKRHTGSLHQGLLRTRQLPSGLPNCLPQVWVNFRFFHKHMKLSPKGFDSSTWRRGGEGQCPFDPLQEPVQIPNHQSKPQFRGRPRIGDCPFVLGKTEEDPMHCLTSGFDHLLERNKATCQARPAMFAPDHKLSFQRAKLFLVLQQVQSFDQIPNLKSQPFGAPNFAQHPHLHNAFWPGNQHSVLSGP